MVGPKSTHTRVTVVGIIMDKTHPSLHLDLIFKDWGFYEKCVSYNIIAIIIIICTNKQ